MMTTQGNTVSRSPDDGVTWDLRCACDDTTCPVQNRCWALAQDICDPKDFNGTYRPWAALAVDPNNNQRVLAGGRRVIKGSTDGGCTWSANRYPGLPSAPYAVVTEGGSIGLARWRCRGVPVTESALHL